jgi:hypothetical protein
MKKIIRLTESELHKIVKESVQRILEGGEFGGPDANLWDLYDWADKPEEEDPLTAGHEYREKHINRNNSK